MTFKHCRHCPSFLYEFFPLRPRNMGWLRACRAITPLELGRGYGIWGLLFQGWLANALTCSLTVIAWVSSMWDWSLWGWITTDDVVKSGDFLLDNLHERLFSDHKSRSIRPESSPGSSRNFGCSIFIIISWFPYVAAPGYGVIPSLSCSTDNDIPQNS